MHGGGRRHIRRAARPFSTRWNRIEEPKQSPARRLWAQEEQRGSGEKEENEYGSNDEDAPPPSGAKSSELIRGLVDELKRFTLEVNATFRTAFFAGQNP